MDHMDRELWENEPYYRDFGERIDPAGTDAGDMDEADELDDYDMEEAGADHETTQTKSDVNETDFRESLNESDQFDDEDLQREAEQDYESDRS